MSSRNKIGIAVLIGVGVLHLIGIYVANTYNALIRSDQQVQSQWAQVENVYQRRQVLVPNLVASMSGARFQDNAYFKAQSQTRSASSHR